MGTFHPIYAGVEKEVLLLVDDHFAHGNLRDWAWRCQLERWPDRVPPVA
jgi:hypothetical protein